MQKAASTIAIILTITICLAYLTVIFKPIITKVPNSELVSESLATITGSMLSIVSLFIGAVVGVIVKSKYIKSKK